MNSPKEENQVIKEKDTVFRCKKVHVQSPSELVYKGIPRDREVYKFAWCFRVSQQDPYIADEIIKLFEKTCKVEASNPR